MKSLYKWEMHLRIINQLYISVYYVWLIYMCIYRFNIEYHEAIKRIYPDKCGVSNQYVICCNAPIELIMN